jgi:hypothetical protein
MKAKLKAVEQTEEITQAEVPEFSEELPMLSVDPTSFDARVAGIESCSVARELSKHWSSVSAYEVGQAEQRGEVKTHEERVALQTTLWRRRWEPKDPAQLEEHIQYIKRKATRWINWGDIGQIWNADPRQAIELWRAIRLEARDEFIGGHHGAVAFEIGEYENDAWRRAQYLAIRDGLIEEWKPRGASEFMLIDQMTQAYLMQLHWTEEAMRRAQLEPRVESYDYREWKEQRKAQAKANQWETGHWDIPYQHQSEALEQAFRLLDLCAKTFQRAARQLANIRLVRAKTARTQRRKRPPPLKSVNAA